MKSFLHDVMHPEIVSGIGIAIKFPLAIESSLFNDETLHNLFEQVIL